MPSARPGRKLSLFSVLGSSLLIGFAIIIGSVLWTQYQLSRQVISDETEQSLRHNHALVHAVLDGRLALARAQLDTLSQRLSLPSSRFSLKTINALRQQLKQLPQQGDTDFLLLSSIDGNHCTQLSSGRYQFSGHCDQIVSLADSNLHYWHLGMVDTGTPQVLISSQAPLISNEGELLAYLHGGIVLSANLGLINQAMSLAPETTAGIAIAYRQQLIATSAANDTVEYSALKTAAQQPDRLYQVSSEQLAMSQQFNLDHPSDLDIRLVSLIQTQGLQQLQQGIIRQGALTLSLAILLALLVTLLALRLSLTPLKNLHHWASKRSWDESHKPFDPGYITEFQDLGKELAEIVSTLNQTETALRNKTDQLELSHKEQRLLTERNRSLLHQLYSLQEQERKHLAQELHDELGQPLAIINTDAYLIKKENSKVSRSYSYAESIQQSTQLMSDVVYKRIVSLRPMPLNDLGLSEAIRHMPAIGALKQQGFKVELDLNDQLPELDDQMAIQLYRITQESLTNALKHSQAEQISIQLELQEQNLKLSINDDGIGFNASQLSGDASHGITGMVERAKAIGANITISPKRNQGTRVLVQVELNPITS